MLMAEEKLLQRQTALVTLNAALLGQALPVLEEIDGASYSGVSSIGGQMRHVIEFYECFLDGLSSARIDYDARRRDLVLEQSRPAAIGRVQALIGRLTTEPKLRGDGAIFVRMEDAAAVGLAEQYLASSIGRELQALSSHTIHHFALIAMTLRAMGRAVDPDFGVSPSTLRHRAELEEAA